MDRRTTGRLAVIVGLTGASALVLQVAWQRVLALRSGVDLVSSTITVTAFLAGLGVGSALGGALADRLGPRRSGRAYVVANLVIAAAAVVSVPVLVDVVPTGAGWAVELVATFAAVALPTVVMGATLPLLVRAVTRAPGAAAVVVGRLQSVNTFGGAAGALVGGWVLVGTVGIVATTRLAAAASVLAALGALVVFGRRDATDSAPPAPTSTAAASTAAVPTAASLSAAVATGPTAPNRPPAPGAAGGTAEPNAAGGPSESTAPTGPVWPWLLLAAVTGAVAIGLQTVFFRIVDAGMRSNAYSFSYVLAGYLTLWALGAAVGTRLVRHVGPPRRWYLGLQAGVAVSAALGLAVAVWALPRSPLWSPLSRWFNSDGLAGGFGGLEVGPAVLAVVVLPALVMGLPVLCMGASLPFAQALVTADLASLGRRTGHLAAANLAGNVAGGLLAGLVVLDRLGSGGTARVLVAALLATVGLAAVATRPAGTAWRPARAALAVAVAVALVAAVPSTTALWRFLHDAEDVTLLVEEDRSCGTVVKAFGDGSAQLHINGASQNGYPFDDFHLLLGLAPALVAADPSTALVVGLGIGSSSAGLLADPQVRRVTSVELCGGNERVIERLAGPDRPELSALLADPRETMRTDDGRAALAATAPGTLDVVVSDTMRTTSSASGATFSVEYYELIRDRLAADGVFATWIPTGRVLASLQQVFPHVAVGTVDGYNGSRFALASRSPLRTDPDELRRRFDAADLPADRRAGLWAALSTLSSACEPGPAPSESSLNRDLHARDEYFLNHPAVPVPPRPRCTP